MKLKLLYFSPTGTTRKIIDGIADGLSINHRDTYDLTLTKNRQETLSFGSDDLVVIGVPVYAGRTPQLLKASFENIKGDGTKAIFIVVYGNRDYDDALLELKTVFENSGFVGIAAGAFIGEHSYSKNVATNRPDQSDLDAAQAFGKNIKAKLLSGQNFEPLAVKGNRPYRDLNPSVSMAPLTKESCINCGLCATYCPVDAIDASDVSVIDANKCIQCCSCVKRCPVHAKHFNQEGFMKIVNMLEANFSDVRKEPELFI